MSLQSHQLASRSYEATLGTDPVTAQNLCKSINEFSYGNALASPCPEGRGCIVLREETLALINRSEMMSGCLYLGFIASSPTRQRGKKS